MRKNPFSFTKRIVLVSAAILICIAAGSFSVFAENSDKKEYKIDHNEYHQELPDSFVVPCVSSSTNTSRSRKSGNALPDRFDSRDYDCVSTVKDQQDTELCWAFSTIAASESSLISSGKASSDIDLSEYHIAYYFDGPSEDKLGLTAGDKTVLTEGFLRSGNNNKFTTFALANWIGPAYEGKYPSDTSIYSSISRQNAYDDEYHLSNAFWINMEDISEIKQNIISHGAISTAIYYKDRYYNSETNAYYNDVYSSANHAVTIVGWDDAFPAEYFNETPDQGDGAWLVKNSRGVDYFDDGYLWVSYYDESLLSASATAFVYEYDESDKYEHNYHYDGSYGTKIINIPDGGSVAAVYRAKGNKEGHNELLKAIGISVADTNTSYSIQIYHNLRDEKQPLSGKAALESPQTGHTKYVGCYTIPLDEEITLQSGELFSIVVTFTGNSMGTYFFSDESYDNGGWIEFTSDIQRGQTFIREPNKAWVDLYDVDGCARIKAFTSNIIIEGDEHIDLVDISDCEIDSIPDKIYTGSAIKPKLHLYYGVDLIKGVDYTVSFSNNINAGTATVTIKGIGAYKGKIEKSFCIKPLTITPVVTLSNTAYVYNGKKRMPIVTVIHGANELTPGTDYTVTKNAGRKSVGKYGIRITLKGNYRGTKEVYFTINPKGTKLSNVRGGKKMLTVRWEKHTTQTTGYEIQYALNSKFTKGKRTVRIKKNKTAYKKITKLKAKKKYYVRIRAYKTVGKTRYYSVWSKVKSATTKK